jgi:hypothetical protein
MIPISQEESVMALSIVPANLVERWLESISG